MFETPHTRFLPSTPGLQIIRSDEIERVRDIPSVANVDRKYRQLHESPRLRVQATAQLTKPEHRKSNVTLLRDGNPLDSARCLSSTPRNKTILIQRAKLQISNIIRGSIPSDSNPITSPRRRRKQQHPRQTTNTALHSYLIHVLNGERCLHQL